ncbi:hypothetical protein [Nocardia xishanensis]|uniref:hypothetical protein n=1 Tax=Nocardia xishanensis TaxID=238964 RepID=UPI0012F4B38D|nr:hypothetical protein [Nocardia xishanensis]
MRNGQQQELVLDVANGDIGVSRALRKSLEAIKSSVSDPQIRSGLDDVLAGRLGMREFGRSEMFAKLFDQRSMNRIDNLISSVSDAERDRLAAGGETVLDHLRNQAFEESTQNARAEASPPIPKPKASWADRSMDNAASASSAAVHPGTRKPNRERVVVPDEPDDDDLYFGERRQRGWLE